MDFVTNPYADFLFSEIQVAVSFTLILALVGYLLFYVIANGERTLLQSDLGDGSLGFVFDNDGVHEVFQHNHKSYRDGKPCCLLVSADDRVHPLAELGWCDRTIVVSMKSKPDLKTWMSQTRAEKFIAPPPSCLEVVYVLYVELFKYPSSVVC